MYARDDLNNISGFSLVELMITLVISSLIVSAVFSAYITQNQVFTAQDQVAEIQQNIRAGFLMMVRDIRMAGYDPSGSNCAEFVDSVLFSNGGTLNETVYTSATQLSFTADLDGDGTIDRAAEDIDGNANTDMTEMEQISYRIGGTSGMDLQRYSTTSGAVEWQTVAEGIEKIEFRYLDASGSSTAVLGNIRSVQISILARSEKTDQNYTNNNIYTPASGTPWDLNGSAPGNAPNDNYHRRLLITTVNCRNMGV